jgi:hypothetical protein
MCLEARKIGLVATSPAVDEAPGQGATPKPRSKEGGYSGRLLLRMPRGLHEELARASDRDGISLNQFITNALAVAVGWGRDEKVAPSRRRHQPRALTVLLALNLLLVAAAAAAAVAFLIAAWLS